MNRPPAPLPKPGPKPGPEPLWQSALAVLGTIILCVAMFVVAGLVER